MKSHTSLLTAAMVAAASASSLQATTIFLDDFNAGVSPAWVTDRYNPAGFSSVGGNLEIKISNADADGSRGALNGAFYNTQGKQAPADATGLWTLSGQIYVDNDVLSGANGGRRSDLWGRSANAASAESSAAYYIFGYRSFDPADPFNAAAPNISSAWRVWDADTANGWVDLGTAVTGGWHDISISFTGTEIKYLLDGVNVYNDGTLSADANHFTTVFAQAYNFGNAAGGSYTAKFDNIQVSLPVPEASSTLALLGSSLGSLALIRRKVRK